MNAVEVRNLSKRYGGTMALENVSFTLTEGVVFGILGANGCGKSTLLRLLATLERPTTGSISIMGRDVAAVPRAVRRQIGFVPEVYLPQRGLTVGEHLTYLATCYALRGRERRAAVDTMLSLVDLEPCRERGVADLSRGQRQRLALASAMVHDPAVVILDEPLAGLDALAREEMLEVLKELRAMGKVVVLSSHNLAAVAPICDAIGLLHRGQLMAVGPLGEVLGRQGSPPRQVRVEIASGLERAQTLAQRMPEVRAFTLEGNTLILTLREDEAQLPRLLAGLIEAGVQIRQFAAGPPQADGALARALQELAA